MKALIASICLILFVLASLTGLTEKKSGNRACSLLFALACLAVTMTIVGGYL